MPHTYSLQNVPSYVAAGEAHYHHLLAEAAEARRFVPERTRHTGGARTRRRSTSPRDRDRPHAPRRVAPGRGGSRRQREPPRRPYQRATDGPGGAGAGAARIAVAGAWQVVSPARHRRSGRLTGSRSRRALTARCATWRLDGEPRADAAWVNGGQGYPASRAVMPRMPPVAALAARSRSQRAVLPSMSVKRKVTVPDGRSGMVGPCAVPSGGGRRDCRTRSRDRMGGRLTALGLPPRPGRSPLTRASAGI